MKQKIDKSLFAENCENAAKSFFLFEKAVRWDKQTTVDRIAKYKVPEGLELQWSQVLLLCKDYATYGRIDTKKYPFDDVFGFVPASSIVSKSDDFSSLLRRIGKASALKTVSETTKDLKNMELSSSFKDFCAEAVECLQRYNAASFKEKTHIESKLSAMKPSAEFSEQWSFVSKILNEFFSQGYVDVSELVVPDCLNISLPPYPIRGTSGIVDIIEQVCHSAAGASVQESLEHDADDAMSPSVVPHSKYRAVEWDKLLSKEQILDCYKQYIGRLTDSIENIKSLKAKNHKFEQIQSKCLEEIQELLDASLSQMNQVMNETVWDKLVIAFFGETNAGKSTLIETFRVRFKDKARAAEIKKRHGEPVDGLIVGDGRSDFTQIYEKYNLDIDGRPFVLIDVPGIEGKEADYLEQIASALKQAHCVFYVQGHNTKPNAATAEKIKGFLSDWVNVYSIYNVRGGASNYDEEEERELLMTKDKLDRENSIKEVFEQILPGIYKGNVSCQGLLALLSVADFHKSRTDLISSQQKIISYFGDRESVFDFSRFSDIVGLVQSQSNDFASNIVMANRNKLQGLSKRISSGLDSIIDEQIKKLDAFNEQLMTFKNAISGYKKDAIASMRMQMCSEVNEALPALRHAANDIIDAGDNVDEWTMYLQDATQSIQETLEQSLQEIYAEGVSNFHQKIETKRKDLDKLKFLRVKAPDIEMNLDIDLSEVVKSLTISFKEGLSTFIKSVFSPIPSLIKLFKNTDDGRQNAKRAAAKAIDNAKPYVMNDVESIIDDIKRSLSKEEKTFSDAIMSEKGNIKKLKLELLQLKQDFKN